jgi:two-component system, cell cycle response regulator
MPISILVIDDSDSMRSQIVRTLREAALFDQCHEARDGIEGFKILIQNRVDLVFCDLIMPKMDGFKFMALVKSNQDLKDIPVIMLTGRGDREFKIRGLETGASDYLTKPFDDGELIARTRVHLKIKALQDELKRSNELLRELSITDPLTHLYNRRFLMDTLEKEFDRIRRKGGSLSLVVLDIDHFKQVNDTYGHQKGDIVLAAVAETTRAELRGYDIAVRYGGEEFMVVLPETPLAEGIAMAERLRSSVGQMVFPPPMETLTVTVSLGVSTYPSDPVDSVDQLIRTADEALYRAKSAGRNRVEAMAGKGA